MKNKGKCFGVSGALMLENFKLNWYLPAIIFFVYFLSGIFPLIISDNNGMMALSALWNYNPGFIALLIFAPIIVSCVMMRFYHRPAASFALHAQPYSRSKLFNTHILTGWFMLALPIVIMGVLFLLIMGSIGTPDTAVTEYYFDEPAPAVEAYRAVDVIIWVLMTISEMSFFYFLYTLAGALVGSTVMQILCSLILVNLVPLIVGLANLYSEKFILGFYGTPDWASALIKNTNPLIRMAYRGGLLDQPERLPCLWYFAAGIVFLILAKAVYSKAKLERVGDSMMFGFFEAAITVTVASIGGILAALIFSSIIDGAYIVVAGALIGLLLTFFVTKIVIERSIKIFSVRNLKILICAFIVLLIFLLLFAFDATSYSKRAVDKDKISSVYIEDLISADGATTLSADATDYSETALDSDVSDRETIDKVYEFNRYIIENNLCSLEKDWDRDKTIIFNYELRGGGQWLRRYYVHLDRNAEAMLQSIMTSDAVVSARSVTDKLKDRANHITISSDEAAADNTLGSYKHTEYLVTEREDIIAILEARDRDIREIDYTVGTGNVMYTNSIYVDISDVSKKQKKYETSVYFYYNESAKHLNAVISELEKKYGAMSEYYY